MKFATVPGALALAKALAGCSSTTGAGGSAGVPLTPFAQRLSANTANLPTHVVVIVQENRTVDNLFQQLPGPTPRITG